MKLKDFKDIVEMNLTETEILDIERMAELEVRELYFMQESVKKSIDNYKKNK